MKLNGKVALVTGASRGIGRAIAIALAKEGAFVGVNYVSNPSAAQKVVQSIEAAGSQAVAIPADISDLEAVEKMVAAVTQKTGVIDILVNNAGVWRGGKLHKLEPADWDKVLDTNLKGMLACTRAVLPAMIAKGSGKNHQYLICDRHRRLSRGYRIRHVQGRNPRIHQIPCQRGREKGHQCKCRCSRHYIHRYEQRSG